MDDWFNKFRPRRFEYLLAVLLVSIEITPLVGQDFLGRTFGAIVSSLAFVMTCFSTSPKRRILILCCFIAFAISIFCSMAISVDVPPFNQQFYQASARVLAIGFYFSACLIIFRDVIRAGEVDINKLCGAVCLYVMIGVVWGQFYQLCDVLDPGCFVLDLSKLERHGVLNAFERASLLNYFSYVTLSTLGYGDISPVTRITRTLAYSEAILGQVYMAILVSRLVGLHIAASSSPTSVDLDE